MPPPLPPDPALGLAIKELREARDLTQEELASRAGMMFGTRQPSGVGQERPSMGDRHAAHRRAGRLAAGTSAGRREGPAKPLTVVSCAAGLAPASRSGCLLCTLSLR
jgi:hypothetical protein